jgi:hypothetical protein
MASNLSLRAIVRPTSSRILPTDARTTPALGPEHTWQNKLTTHNRFKVEGACGSTRKRSNLPTLVSVHRKTLEEHLLTMPSQQSFLDQTSSAAPKPRANVSRNRHSSKPSPFEAKGRRWTGVALQRCSSRPDDVRLFALSSRNLRI